MQIQIKLDLLTNLLASKLKSQVRNFEEQNF